MSKLAVVAPLFVEIAHHIVWCSVATVDRDQRPRSRVLHPYWEWDGQTLIGWVATMPTAVKRTHLAHSPYASCSYWAPSQDAALRPHARLDLFRDTTPPLGYDPGSISVPGWDSPTSAAFAVLQLRPWRLGVLPGDVFMQRGSGGMLRWSETGAPST